MSVLFVVEICFLLILSVRYLLVRSIKVWDGNLSTLALKDPLVHEVPYALEVLCIQLVQIEDIML